MRSIIFSIQRGLHWPGFTLSEYINISGRVFFGKKLAKPLITCEHACKNIKMTGAFYANLNNVYQMKYKYKYKYK